MKFLWLADDAGLDDFHGATQAITGAALIAHLCGHFHLFRGVTHQARLVDRVRQRFLAIHVLAHLHGHETGDRVDMIRGGDDDRIDLLAHFFEHLAEISIGLRAGKGFLVGLGVGRGPRVQSVLIHVAKGDDVASELGRLIGVTAAFAAGPDDGDVEARVEILPAEERGRSAEDDTRGQGGVFDELTTAQGRSRPGWEIGLWHGANDYCLRPDIHKDNFRFALGDLCDLGGSKTSVARSKATESTERA